MGKLLEQFASHPWWVLLCLLAISVLAASQLPHVQVHVSSEELLVMDDEDRQFQQQVAEEFGDERVMLLFLSDPHMLHKETLVQLKQVIGQLEKLPFVERTDSLFSIPYLRTVDGYMSQEPYLATLPEDDAAAASLHEQALGNAFLRHVLLSADRKVMAVAIVLKDAVDAAGRSFDDDTISSAVQATIAPLRGIYQQVFAIGFPQVRSEITRTIVQEQGELFPLAMGALLIALFILLRQVLDIMIPVVTAGLSILWTLGLMGFAGIPLNVVTSIVPVLLVIVGSTEDIHMLAEFRRAQKQNLPTEQAVRQMVHKMGRIVLLTFLTSYIGFLTVSLSRIEVLFQFGIVASTGLFLNFAITISLIPAMLTLAGRWQLDGGSRFIHGARSRLADRYWRYLRQYRRPVMLFASAITLVAAAGIPRIQINHNIIDSLAVGSDARAHFQEVEDHLAGLESFSIVIDSGIQDTFLKARYLRELVKIQHFIAELDLARGAGHSSTSFADYLALLNAAFLELEEPRMPDSDDVVNELMIFLNFKHVAGYVSEDYSKARILVRHNIDATGPLQQYIGRIQQFIDDNLDPGLDARITGDSKLTLTATKAMIGGQLQSILLLMLIIVLIISLLFAELKVGLLALLPNVFPVIVLFGVMGYFGIPLNIGTTMAAAIAIGLAVDDTMHFMLRYNEELKSSKSQLLAMHATLDGEALPVIATSVALICGFLVFTLSDFPPIVQFGMLSALVIFTALVADFVITPLAIASLRLVTLWDLMSLQLREEVIGKSQLFQSMRPWQIRRFILSSTVAHYRAGTAIFRKGDISTAMYLVMTGEVEIHLPKPGTEDVIVERFLPGQWFGDVALLAQHPRKTDAVAAVDTSVLLLTQDAIQSTTRWHPGIAALLFFNLSTDLSRRFVRLVEKAKS